MGTRRTKLLGFVAWASTIALVLGVLPPAPVAGSHGVDLANAAPSGWTATAVGSGGNDNCPTSRACDANDSTGRRIDDTCFNADLGRGTHPYCLGTLAYTYTSGVTSFEISSFRVKFQTCQNGDGSTCGGAQLDMVALIIKPRVTGTCATNATEYHYMTQSASPLFDSGEVELDTPMTIGNGAGDNSGLCFWVETVAQNTTQWFVADSMEVYGEGLGPEVVPITDYIFNLRITHPPFMRDVDWQWRDVSWTGTWVVTDSDNDVLETSLDGTMPGNEVVGSHDGFEIHCPLICGEDSYTITINDTGANKIATYVVDGDDDGTLIANVRGPKFATFHVCYNATTDQCLGISSTLWNAQAAGTIQWNYTWEGDPATVTFGHDDPLLSAWFVNPMMAQSVGQTEGNYRATDTTVDETQSSTFNMYIENENGFVWISGSVNFGTGGAVETKPPDGPAGSGDGIRTCNSSNLDLIACRLGQLLDVLGGTVESFVANLWGPSVSAVRSAALTKLPFAYVVMATDGIGAQLALVTAEVENSDDCEGITLNVPLYYGSDPSTPTPTNMPIVVLECAQLEPFMGTSWYQAIRTAMDPALWLLFAWSQFKSLQPRPSLNG